MFPLAGVYGGALGCRGDKVLSMLTRRATASRIHLLVRLWPQRDAHLMIRQFDARCLVNDPPFFVADAGLPHCPSALLKKQA
jgi:hypothetical protein